MADLELEVSYFEVIEEPYQVLTPRHWRRVSIIRREDFDLDLRFAGSLLQITPANLRSIEVDPEIKVMGLTTEEAEANGQIIEDALRKT